MTTNGLMMCTFTPLMGISDVVKMFLPTGKIEDCSIGERFVIMATWDDAPHLTDDQKKKLWASLPPHQRDARSKGVPQLGSGAIYPVPESEFVIKPLEGGIPDWWPRVYSLDVGWKRTAALWGAHDVQSDVVYLYSEHYQGNAEPAIHANAIRARGEWIPGVIDPAARGRGQKDGERLMENYIDLGLDLTAADNSVEAGIYRVWQRLSTGRLKVCENLVNWLSEFRVYRRDENGKIVKENDHLMDDTRYLEMSGIERAIHELDAMSMYEGQSYDGYNQNANETTGY
jgi:hypothetical protein